VTETAPAAAPQAPPIQILLTSGALVLAAVTGLAASVAQLNAGFRTWAFNTITTADHDAMKPGARNPIKTMPSPAQIHSSVNSAVQTYLLMAVVGGAIVIMLAVATRRGKYWTRWAIIGVWVLSTLVGGAYGLSYLVGIASDAPAAYKYLSFLSALLTVLAIVLVNLRPSRQYLDLSRPPRPDRGSARPGGFGGIFGPRAPRGTIPTESPAPRPAGRASASAPAGKRPATVRPAAQPRTKSRPRVDLTKQGSDSTTPRVAATVAADPGEVADPSASRPASRPRGKSRRT
jgi:hypothetical protein